MVLRFLFTAILFPLSISGLTGCSEDTPGGGQDQEHTETPGSNESQTPTPPTGSNTELKGSKLELTNSEKIMAGIIVSNSFRVLMHQHEIEQTQESPKSNILISPLSLWYALGMIAEWAKGETQEEIVRALGFQDRETSEINEFFKHLTESLSTLDALVDMRAANSQWYRNDIKLQEQYVEQMRLFYGAPVRYVPTMSSIDTMNALNDWVSEATDGFLQKILDEPLSDEVFAVIMNALYFKGLWTDKFDPANTSRQNFHNGDGTISNVEMMLNHSTPVQIINESKYQAVKIPYGSGAYSMIIVSPYEDYSLENCIKDLAENPELIIELGSKALDMISLRSVMMPKFSIEYSFSATNLLKEKLKVIKAFSKNSGCDLSGMFHQDDSDIDRSFSDAKQICKIAVDETARKRLLSQ